jgi:putative salt-induced outer membrane protein YdiY
MDSRTVGVAFALLGMALATQAGAQDEETDAIKFTLDAGFASTSGNSNITTITGGQTFSYTAGRFVLSQAFDVLFNQTDDSTTAEAYKGNIRGDRTLGTAERLSVFLDLRGSRNRFAGISRRSEQALGVAYDVVKTEKDVVAVEGAATLVQQRGTNGIDNNYPAALAGASYLHYFTPEATFTVTGEYIPNLENGSDYRLNGIAKILAPLSGAIALTLSYMVRFDNIPEPGFEKTDKFFTSGIQISL